MLLLLPLIAVLAETPPPPAGSGHDRALAREQLSFGMKVAQRGLWHEARFRFEKAVALDPSHAGARNDLAVALEQEGLFDLARAAYEEALRLEPGNASIQQNYDLFREADDKRNRKKKKQQQPPPAQP